LVESEGCTDEFLVGGWNACHLAIHVTQQITIAVDHRHAPSPGNGSNQAIQRLL
jgi:hypothetical protein